MATQASLDVTAATTINASWGDSVAQHLPTVETATPAVVFEGKVYVRSDLDALMISDGSTERELARYGAATTFTVSSITQSAGVSYTTNRAVFSRQGRWITGECTVTFSSAGSSGYGVAVNTTGLPTPATGSGATAGIFLYTDVGTAAYVGVVTMSSTTFNFWVHNAGLQLGGTPAFAITGSDVLSFSFSYEASA